MRFCAYWGGETGLSYRDEILHRGRVSDIITHVNLDDDRFGVFEGAGVKFPTFMLTCVVVLKTL